jgi:hypothetical protein
VKFSSLGINIFVDLLQFPNYGQSREKGSSLKIA